MHRASIVYIQDFTNFVVENKPFILKINNCDGDVRKSNLQTMRSMLSTTVEHVFMSIIDIAEIKFRKHQQIWFMEQNKMKHGENMLLALLRRGRRRGGFLYVNAQRLELIKCAKIFKYFCSA